MKRFFCIFAISLLLIGGAAIVSFGDSADDLDSSSSVSDPADDFYSDSEVDPDPDLSQPALSDDQPADQDPEALDPEEAADPSDLDLDSSPSLSVGDIALSAEAVYMSVPEDNDYPPSAPLLGGVYLDVTTTQLGDLLIYVPTSFQYRSFTKTVDGQPVNVTSSSISGYTYSGSDYSIRWSSFGRAQYRPYSGSYSYQDLDISEIKNTNIVFIESIEDLPPVPDSDVLSLIVVFLLGVVVLCLFIRRF